MTARDIRRTGWLGAPQQAVEAADCWALYRQDTAPGYGTLPEIKLAIGLAAISLVLNAAVIAFLIWRAC